MARHRFFPVLLCVILGALAAFSVVRAQTPPLLHAAIGNWLAGKEEWALTQRVRTLSDDGQVTAERLERYDPSLPDSQRWHLLEVNGQPPSEAQRQTLERRKNLKPRRQTSKSPEDLLDFAHAVPTAATPLAVTYTVAVRSETILFTQTEKIIVQITVGRESRAIERVTASLRDPMRVAFGLAKVIGMDFDLSFEPADEGTKSATDDGQASGTGRATLSKLGARMEYRWSDFKRVTAYTGHSK